MLDVLIIGAGQAGLALAYELRSTRLDYLLVEEHQRIGNSWRSRYDSLTLFTPRAYSALPGFALSGDQEGYATRDEFADYLEAYAKHFQFPIRLGTKVEKLQKTKDKFHAEVESGDPLSSRIVVIATGPFQLPRLPALADQISQDVPQFTAANYKNPSQLPAGTILIVGDGATGRDIANELSSTHRVVLATGRPRRLLPEKLLGRSTWWWLDKLGILRLPSDTLIGGYLRKADPFPARGRDFDSLRRKGVLIRKYVTDLKGQRVQFADSEGDTFDSVIWATGYRDDTDWVLIPEATNADGSFAHREGISPIPNLYFIGRPWQRSRASALIPGVGVDAQSLKQKIVQASV